MPKNSKGGKGHRKAKAGGNAYRRTLLFKEDGQEYAEITNMFGNGHVECTCVDNVVRLGCIRGKMKNRIWINKGDLVLCGLRDFQDTKADIIHKYNPDEIRQLKSLGEIPEKMATVIENTSADISTLQETIPDTVEDLDAFVEFV